MNFSTVTASIGQGSPVLDVHAQPTLNLENDALRDLTRFKRITSEQITPAFLHSAEFSDETRRAITLLNCSDSVTVRDNKATAHMRCKRRICATCSHIEGKKWSSRIQHAFKLLEDYMLDEELPEDTEREDTDCIIGLKLTLNAGQLCPIDELPLVTRLLHKLWPRLLRIKRVKDHLKGSIRATEITVSHDETGILANPHMHGLFLLELPPGEKCDEWLQALSTHILRYWRRAIMSALTKAKVYGRSISSSAQLIEPLNAHTPHDASSWASYCVKGASQGLAHQLRNESVESTLDEIVKVWTTVDKAIKGIRMVSASGIIKDALAHHQQIENKDAELTTPPTEPARPTHRYSQQKRKYIPVEDWDPSIDRAKNWPLQAMRLSHRHQPRQLFNLLNEVNNQDSLSDEERIRHYLSFRELLPARKTGHRPQIPIKF